MSASQKRRFVRVVALVVLLGAILPNVTFVGHWSVRGLEDAAASTSADGHAGHCHGSSSCSDQAAYGIQWWKGGDGVPFLAGDSERSLLSDDVPRPLEAALAVIDPPPRYA
jgi:hypothetical protein